MNKIVKIILIITIIITSNFAILANTVQAVEQQQIQIFTTGNLIRNLKYDGMLIKTAHAVYEENGKQYPAYCLNKDLQGVGDKVITYETTNGGKLTDVGLWRVITNGYPYKSLEQLGVVSEEEAYIATKQAIYCYIYNRGTEKYTGVDESGERTVNAMNIILEAAQNSTETPDSSQIEIIQTEKWKEEGKYISKEYEVKSNIQISKYLITLQNQPRETIITNVQNNEQNEFQSNEKFKILIPISSLEESGEFKIKINTQMETKPIYYGLAPDSTLQDYALTGFSYEEVPTELNQQYEKNNTKIIIKKQDDETKQNLKGAIFQILDEEKNIIKEMQTDKNGEIKIEYLLPGIYYIKEIQSPEGYQDNNEVQKIEIALNEEKTLVIENSKIIIEIPEEVPEPEKPEIPIIEEFEPEIPEVIEPKIEITLQIEEVPVIEEIKKLPVTGM